MKQAKLIESNKKWLVLNITLGNNLRVVVIIPQLGP